MRLASERVQMILITVLVVVGSCGVVLLLVLVTSGSALKFIEINA